MYYVEITFVEAFSLKYDIYRDLFLASFVVLTRLLCLGFFEEAIIIFWPEKLPLGPGENPSSVNFHSYNPKGQNPNPGSNPQGAQNPNPGSNPGAGGSASTDKQDPIVISILGDLIKESTDKNNATIRAWSKELQEYAKLPFGDLKNVNGGEDIIIDMLKKQSNIFTKHIYNRMSWLGARAINATMESRAEMLIIRQNLVNIQEEYWNNVAKLDRVNNQKAEAKQFYALLNKYRSSAIKELNKADSIILKDISTSLLHDHPGLRKAINQDYTEAKKEFNKHDSHIKKQIGELINAKK